jgi:hypothetical protein
LGWVPLGENFENGDLNETTKMDRDTKNFKISNTFCTTTWQPMLLGFTLNIMLSRSIFYVLYSYPSALLPRFANIVPRKNNVLE